LATKEAKLPASFFPTMSVRWQIICKPKTALALLNTFKNIITNEKITHAGGRGERRDSAFAWRTEQAPQSISVTFHLRRVMHHAKGIACIFRKKRQNRLAVECVYTDKMIFGLSNGVFDIEEIRQKKLFPKRLSNFFENSCRP
jgi:hypothetical protein